MITVSMTNMTCQMSGVALEMGMYEAGALEIHLKQYLVTVASSSVLALLATIGVVFGAIHLTATGMVQMVSSINLTPTATAISRTSFLYSVIMNVSLAGLHLRAL